MGQKGDMMVMSRELVDREVSEKERRKWVVYFAFSHWIDVLTITTTKTTWKTHPSPPNIQNQRQ